MREEAIEPILLIDRSEVREGKLTEVEARFRELADFVAEHEPRVIAYSVFFSEDHRTVTVLQIHPDSESLEHHMRAAADFFVPFAELLRMESMDVYGKPSEELLDRLRRKSHMLGATHFAIHDLRAGFGRFTGG